ncbi:MAG: MFS transporter [Pirellulaceae bacterium]|nr:MFS transporter [Pirellulaceae bacterium]
MANSPSHLSGDRLPGGRHLLRDKTVLCWAMYDWANSAYTTLLITVLVTYLQRVVFPTESWGHVGAVVWAWGISASMFLGAVLSPIVGAIADARRCKRQLLAITALVGSVASILLGVVPPRMYVIVVALFVVANLMLELSLGVYNGFLPEIVDDDQVNAASAWGYGLGYLGGGIALLLAMGIIHFGDRLALPTMTSRLQCSLILMGCWWGIFTLPAILVLRDNTADSPSDHTLSQAIRGSVGDVTKTLRDLRKHAAVALFLLSFLFYNDGVQTIISQASTFALQELAFPEAELMAVILMIQFLALPGAIIVGWCADKFGQKGTLLTCLVVWAGVLVSALAVTNKLGFWLLAMVIAFVLGGTQSVSRSLMATMIPKDKNAQYFGFFNLSGKATSFLGTFLFGAIVAVTGSSRVAIFGLLPLFLIGAILLWFVQTSDRAANLRPKEHA